MQVHYLEIVTPDVDATCAAQAKMHGVEFSEPQPHLGNARTTTLANGGQLGVRAPMHESEAPVTRPYMLVEDVEAALAIAVEAGGEVMHPAMELPGGGTFAIYGQGGIQWALWKRS